MQQIPVQSPQPDRPIKPQQIPLSTLPERPIRRHHTARYYVHLVKESLTTRVSKLICSIFLTLLFLVGIITFILWLSLRPHRPRFYVQEFSIPGFTHEVGFQNAQIIYNVTARNSNQNIGVNYDSVEVAVFYEDQSIGDSTVIFKFYQEPKNTTVIAGILGGTSLTVTSQMWQRFLAARSGGQVVFRLKVTSVIRFKISTWDSKRHRMYANCPVGVGPDGLLLPSYRFNKCPVYFN